MRLRKLALLGITIGVASVSIVAYAGSDYRCTISRLSQAEGDSGPVYEMYQKLYVGKEFTVERVSGVMTGALKNSYVTKPEVIDPGSDENSYKVVTIMRLEESLGPGSSISALTVNEYVDTAKKPFVFLETDRVYFGSCEHF